MFTNTTFTYDNVQSTTYGLMLVRIDSGTIESPFGINQSILEEKIKGNSIPYFYGVDEQPLTFTTTFYREGEWDYDTRMAVVRWLFQKTYKDFISTDNPNIIYKCICVDNPKKVFTGTNEGYIVLNWRCNASHAWSPVYTQNFDLSSNTTTTIIQLSNLSNISLFYCPEIEVALQGDSTGFSLKNLTNSGLITSFSGLNIGESIYMNQRKQVISSTGLYRYSNWNKQLLNLVYGNNNIEVVGKVKITIRMQYPLSV